MNLGVFYEEDGVYYNICSCGEVSIDKSENHTCKCGNTIFNKVSNKYNGGRVSTDYMFKVLDQGGWGFILEKIKLTGRYKKSDRAITEVKITRDIFNYDFRGDKFYIKFNDGHVIENPRREFMREFFRGCDEYELMDELHGISKSLKHISDRFYVRGHGNNLDFDRLYNKLFYLKSHPIVNLFENLGCDMFLSFIIHNYESLHTKETKPHKILGIPKYALNEFIKEKAPVSKWSIQDVNETFELLGKDNSEYLFKIGKQETDRYTMFYFATESKRIREICVKYKYNPKSVIDYCFRRAKLEQGIMSPTDVLNLLVDYIRMCEEMEVEYEKYPKSLKKMHDIITMNYKAVADEIKIKKFAKISEKYKSLELKNKEYAFIMPMKPDDLIKEGKGLGHCVASYVNDVINEKCNIVLMRKNENIQSPYITIEVRGNELKQTRGNSNRYPDENEMKFIHKWCDEKKIMY